MSQRIDPNPDDPDSIEPLRMWARIAALVAGGVAGIVGGTAIFISSNQAGTAAILLISVVLLLIGLQGTPLQTVKTGENSFELASLRRRAKREIKRVAETSSPEIAEAVAESFSMVDPWLSPMTQRMMKALTYEREVGISLIRMGFEMEEQDPNTSRNWVVDFVARDSNNQSVGAITAYSTIDSNFVKKLKSLYGEDYPKKLEIPVVLVIPKPVPERLSTFIREHEMSSKVSVACWRNPNDDKSLNLEITQLIGRYYH